MIQILTDTSCIIQENKEIQFNFTIVFTVWTLLVVVGQNQLYAGKKSQGCLSLVKSLGTFWLLQFKTFFSQTLAAFHWGSSTFGEVWLVSNPGSLQGNCLKSTSKQWFGLHFNQTPMRSPRVFTRCETLTLPLFIFYLLNSVSQWMYYIKNVYHCV